MEQAVGDLVDWKEFWFCIRKSMPKTMHELRRDNPYNARNPAGRKLYDPGDVIFAVQVTREEAELGLNELVRRFNQGIKPFGTREPLT